MPKIAIVGHICIDHNRSENASYQGWGSSVMYMGQYLQRTYHLRPTAITNYGPDMLKYLPDTETVPRRPSRPKTLVFENDTRAGKRIQHCYNIESADAAEILPFFDLVMYSEEDYPQAFELAKQWKQSAATKVVVTQGAEGASIVERDRIVHVPTTPIHREKIVDSVGCGDTFAATVTYTYWQNRNDLEAAIRAAHKAAGAKLLAVTV